MFLRSLNNEEKKMFLDMAVYVSKANGIIEKSESDLLEQYCNEMGIASYDMSALCEINEIKEFFSNASDSIKRVVTLELIGLGYVDGEFEEVENQMVRNFALGIGLSEEVYDELRRDIEEYTVILGIIQKHVFVDQ